jgi:ABC-type lipoprotein export system ATPase subunit/bifunctional DNA-binding transcriptional regulator/antitoxin component of YhaV-PrlF toxin-antitoxin module
LVKIYRVADREVVALQGLELTVDGGEMIAIVGPSGAGKSTLLNLIGGLDRPSAGRVLVEGENLSELSDAALDHYRREQAGFVWQLPGRNLIPYLTARENVELPMVVTRLPTRERREHAAELLEAVELADRADHVPAQLSGGEQQRVAIAVALANRPRLLLADEPTGEVDSVTADAIYETFRRLNEAFGLTVLIVTHDPGIIGWVDRVVAIRDGRVSTETLRVEGREGRAEKEQGREDDAALSSEYLVVDSAGRLQIPERYREQYGIGGRVQLEPTDEGLLMRPAGERKGAKEAKKEEQDVDETQCE